MTAQEKEDIEFEKSLALDRRIASGEVSLEEGIELLVAAGVPRGIAGRRAWIVSGHMRDEKFPDPKTLPGGSGL